MKKKIIAITMMLSMAAALCSCGKEQSQETTTTENLVKKDVIEFVSTELPSIKAKRDSAIGIYNSYFANDNADVDAFVVSLKNDAIPGMEQYLQDLNAIETETDDVTQLKALYAQSAQRQYDAMKMVLSALEGDNADYLTQAENLVSESNELMKQYNDMLNSVASENGIIIKK
ncbi:MAG: hypothetical protein PUG10_08600 [Lachnospiraceae bacterium]|nr:hypothetical protein [Lachnospiraceae bacterium]